jgi:hypothetical protein
MNSNKHQSPENWNTALDRALKNLPERPAPASLLPLVMAQVQERAAEKWHWRSSAFWLGALSGTLLLALVSWLGSRFYETSINPVLYQGVGACRTVFNALAGSLIGGSLNVSNETFRFTLIAAGLLLLAMYVTCVGVGSFVYRVVRR